MSIGDSRVGKTTVIRLLIDLITSQGKKMRVYDHDNRRKLEPYKDIIPIKTINFNGGTDEIIDELRHDYDVIVVDMPGQHIEKICDYIDKTNLFKSLDKVNWRLTFLQPISHRKDCVEYLSQLLNFAGDKADYVIVKNQHFDQRFKLYQDNGHSKLIKIGGTDVVLGGLNKYSYEAIERVGKPYSQINSDISIYSVYRAYAYRWIKSFYQSITQNSLSSEYLGLLQHRQEPRYDDF